MFQFPSNGKVYSKKRRKSMNLFQENLGFNSLQTGKCIQSIWHISLQPRFRRCFNSLQTGKCIQRRMALGYTKHCGTTGFNSLQTGKCIQSIIRIERDNEIVSEFQFPSNGKVYSKANYLGIPPHNQ